MKLAINLRSYFQGKIGGLENVVRNVCGGIAAVQEQEGEPLTIFAHESEADNVASLFPYGRIILLSHENAEQTIYEELQHGDYDLLFCPLLVLNPLNAPTPSAIVMPDLQHEYFPEFFDRKILDWRRHTYRASAVRADLVFTLSEYSKNSIVERFGVAREKVEIMNLDADDEFRQSTPGWAA